MICKPRLITTAVPKFSTSRTGQGSNEICLTFLNTNDKIKQNSLFLEGLIEYISDKLTPLCGTKIDERPVPFILHY